MSKLKEAAEKFGFTPSEIEILTKEEVTTEEFDQVITDAKGRNTEYFRNTVLPDELKEATKGKISVIKMKKLVNTGLGLGLTSEQIGEIEDVNDLFGQYKTKLEEEKKTWGSGDKDKLAKELNDTKLSLNEKIELISQYEANKESYEKGIEAKYAEMQRKSEVEKMYNKMEREQEIADVPGKAFSLEAIKTRVLSEYLIKEDGLVYDKENPDVRASYPGQERLIGSIQEIWSYFAEKAEILPKSNGGKPPAVLMKDGKKVIATNKLSAANEAKLKRLGGQ